jgi:hypothetical protein
LRTILWPTLPYFTLEPDQTVREWAVWKILTPGRLISGRIWVGHDRGSELEGNVQVYVDRSDGPICLGDLYLHKHTGIYHANDYYWLKDLAKISPVRVVPGDEIRIVRDVHNITPSDFWNPTTINCWDIEVRLNAETD